MMFIVVCGGFILNIGRQEDLAFKAKQKEDKKKLAEAQARASQKGPMGKLSMFLLYLYPVY